MRHEAIYATHPNVTSIDDDTGAFDSGGNAVVLDESKVTAKIAELQSAYNAQAYARSRATEYPSIQEQLDLQYWDKVNSTSKWDEAVKAIKDKYPKG